MLDPPPTPELEDGTMRTLVVGESLIDLVQDAHGSTIEHVGGSPANVAVGLSRLGHDTTFRTLVGDDERGARIASHLEGEGVSLAEGVVGELPTSVARATLDATGAATYSFEVSWGLHRTQPLEGATHVHTGSIAATLEPGASTVLSMIQRARPNATISYDPNARPSLMGDPHDVRAKVEAFIGLSDVVKASDEDIAWLYDGAPMAGLLSGLLDAGLLGGVGARDRLRSAALADVRPALDRALACAAITVSRAGANPPGRADIATS